MRLSLIKVMLCFAAASCITSYSLIAQCPINIWDTSNDGSAYINDFGNKAIYGNFTNVTESQYVNDGRLYFFGDINNHGLIGDGYGYEYIKTCNQEETLITGGGTTEFNILDIDNPTGVILKKEMSIKTNLQFSGGIIHTDRTRTDYNVRFIEGSGHSGSNDDMHVNGTICKVGGDPFVFPLGDGDHMSPMRIRGQNSFDKFTATYISQNLDFIQRLSKGVYPPDSQDFNVLRVQDKEFWTLEGGQSTTITLYFTNYSEINRIVDDINDLIVVGWDGEKWVSLGQTDLVSVFGTGTVTSRSVVPNNYEAFTFGLLDTDGDQYADSEDPDRFDPCVPDPISDACQNNFCVSIDAAVYLEGALYKDGSYLNEMRTQVNDFGYLPGQKPRTLLGVATDPGQPYSSPPWLYNGEEGKDINEIDNIINSNVYPDDIVDWVLLSLRTSESIESTVCQKAAFINRDGQILMIDYFDCCNQETDEFYLVIEHRNHLAVMTPEPIKLDEGGVLKYDFRNSESYTALLGYTQKMIFPGMFAMYAGNGEQVLSIESPRDINSNDNGFWARDNGKHSGYYNQDYDLNGDVNVHDKAIWINNNGIFTDVETSFN